jgi:hypothetical protein
MNGKTISQDYANDLIFELEKAFWDERGKGARFRLTTLGRAFFNSRCLPRLESNEIGDMVRAIERVLREEGIVTGVSAETDGRMLRIRVDSCAHRPVEERMIAHETKPFACVPANLIVLAIEEKLDRPAELAEVKLEKDGCHILVVLFDQRPSLD